MSTQLGPTPFPLGTQVVGKVRLIGVAQVSLTALVAVFDRSLSTLYPGAYWDAQTAANYTLAAGTGATWTPVIGLATLDSVQTQVVLETDTPMEDGVTYTLTVANVRASTGESLSSPATWSLVGAAGPPGPSLVQVADERYSDLVQLADDQGGLGYAFTADQDLVNGTGAQSLRARVYRRVFSSPGDWGWDPGYGAGIKVGALARAGRLQEAANAATEQIRREPDVVDASVTASLVLGTTGAYVALDCRIRTAQASVQYTYQVAG